MFAQLGSHTFDTLKSPTSISDSRSVRYGKISLINGKDALQYTGEDSRELSLSLSLDIAFVDVESEIEALVTSMTSAEVLPFVMGDGKIIGNYVITDIDIKPTRYSNTGKREAATLSVNLIETTSSAEVAVVPIAVTSTTTADVSLFVPTAEIPALPIARPAREVMTHIEHGREGVRKINTTADAVRKGIKAYKRAVREIKDTADAVADAYARAKTTVEATQKIIERAKELPTSLTEAIDYANDLAAIDSVIDSATLDAKIAKLTISADTIDINSTKITAYAATKEGGD